MYLSFFKVFLESLLLNAPIFSFFSKFLFSCAETDGRDMCCVISSLTVLLLDPYFRTLNGFQSLIQKEWVIMGHPFCTRLRHIYTNEEENQQVLLHSNFNLEFFDECIFKHRHLHSIDESLWSTSFVLRGLQCRVMQIV